MDIRRNAGRSREKSACKALVDETGAAGALPSVPLHPPRREYKVYPLFRQNRIYAFRRDGALSRQSAGISGAGAVPRRHTNNARTSRTPDNPRAAAGARKGR